MTYDKLLSNGPACASAEWLMELIAMEVEGAYPDDCLPTLAPLFVAPIGKGPSTPPSKANPHPIARPLEDLAGYVLTI